MKIFQLCFFSLFFACNLFATDFISDTFDNLTVCDVDGDGLVNCVDYSVCFKRTWDTVVPPGYEYCCEIVRNRNINHLFIRARYDYESSWIYIEPQGNKNRYLMKEIWGSRYSAGSNVYGETWLWLNTYITPGGY